MFIFYPIKIVGTPESPRLQTMGSNYFIEVSYYVPNLCLLVIALFGFFLTLVTFVCLMIFPLHQMKPNTKNLIKQVEHWEKETRKWREEKRCRLISEGIEKSAISLSR